MSLDFSTEPLLGISPPIKLNFIHPVKELFCKELFWVEPPFKSEPPFKRDYENFIIVEKEQTSLEIKKENNPKGVHLYDFYKKF